MFVDVKAWRRRIGYPIVSLLPMAIPALLSSGVLPAGLHEATLAEVAERFGSMNPSRQRLQKGLEVVATTARSTGYFVDLVLDGSFVTDKTEPGDIDAVLRTKADYWTAVVPLASSANAWLTEPERMKALHGVYAVIEDAGGSMVDFYASMRPEEALSRGLAANARRGLVRVTL